MDPGWNDARHLLCVSFAGLGGLLVATPAMRALQQSGPKGRRITLLATKAGTRYARYIPEVDESIAYEPPGKHASDSAMRYLLQMRGFDAAVVFSSRPEDAAPALELCEVAGISLRLASTASWESLHPARAHLDAVAAIGARIEEERLSFQVPARAVIRARLKLEEAGLDPRKPLIAVHPGCGDAEGGWANEPLALAARQLAVVLGSQIVIVGDASQRELAESVRRSAGDTARSLAGSLSFEELAATLEFSTLAISNDRDISHLAAAVRTPVVDLRGDPRHSPWMVAHRVIEGTTVEEAIAATCDLWLDIHWRVAA